VIGPGLGRLGPVANSALLTIISEARKADIPYVRTAIAVAEMKVYFDCCCRMLFDADGLWLVGRNLDAIKSCPKYVYLIIMLATILKKCGSLDVY
jgi:NAD(P)H-hydrate repair Nnr-like enzyme with NAD(P)H-hydrate dehydratase domain